MTHDVFISYASEDKQVADRACRALEDEGVRCWIAPRDIRPGQDYEEAIVEAIASSRAFVLILSAHSNASPHVKREVQHAFAEGSRARVIPFRIEPVAYSKPLSYYLGSVQWIDAFEPPLEEHLRRLAREVRAGGATTLAGSDDATAPRPAPAPRSRAALWVAGLAAALLLAAILSFVAYRSLDRRGNGRGNANAANVTSATPTPTRATPTPASTPTPQASPTPRPTRTPIRNLNLRIPANLRPLNINRVRPQN